MPQVIRHIAGGVITFYAIGHAEEVQSLLNAIPGIGKKNAMGWGVVDRWEVTECGEDYTTYHPEYGLMRPMPVEEIDIDGYPIMEYAVRPPYWKQCNMKLCYVPLQETKG